MTSTKGNPSVPNAEDKRKILLVDDHPILRQSLAQVIDQQKCLVVCGEADNAADALALVEKTRPELVLIDISLRGGDGIELLKDIRARFPKTLALVLSMHDEFVYAERALKAGARGYIMKQEKVEQLLLAINRVLSGAVYVSQRLEKKIVDQHLGGPSDSIGLPINRLTDRELQVFRLVGSGYSTKEIASELKLSPKTIESHREHIKEKLQLSKGEELVKRAVEWTKSEQELMSTGTDRRASRAEVNRNSQK